MVAAQGITLWAWAMTSWPSAQRAILAAILLTVAGCSMTSPTVSTGEPSFVQAFAKYRQAPFNDAHWLSAKEQLGAPSVAQAYELQSEFVKHYARFSDRAGYKVALGGKGAQALLGAQAPVVGVLFDNMFIPNESSISASRGQVLAVEADLIVVVGDARINNATSIGHVAESLDAVVPALEIPDLVLPLQSGEAARFVATNAGAHLYALGRPVKVGEPAKLLERLARMRVSLVMASGAEVEGSRQLAEASGSAIMGHPLNAVLFLLDELRARGERLAPGDRISLGAFSKPFSVVPLMAGNSRAEFSVHYDGLGSERQSVRLVVNK